MIAKEYNLPSHTSGDTFEGFSVSIKVDDIVLDLTGATIEMDVRTSLISDEIYKKYIVGNGFTITDAVNGEFSFDSQIISIPSYKYYYEIRITTNTGLVYTILNGTWCIVK